MSDRERTIYILAGPNGAGKTTFARQYLPAEAECLTFINADLIAAGLAPFQPQLAAVRAGRIMLDLIDQQVARGESFAFETTLAGKSFAKSIPVWRSQGYVSVLYFLALPTVDQALDRVARRIRQGGHAVNLSLISGCCWTIPAPSPSLWNPEAERERANQQQSRAPEAH